MVGVISDYDCEFHYHPGKANKVVNALSQKSIVFAISVEKMPRPLQADMCDMEMEMIIGKLSALTSQLTGPLMERFNKKALEER